jgi:hypothetical protein
VPQWLTNAVELGVGVVCIGAAVVGARHPGRLRVLAAILALGGLAAVVHAAWAIATG